MKITVILCTYNRCKSLSKALESLMVSELPAKVDWEVLVLDNNSADMTRNVVEEFGRKYPGRVNYIFEPRQGKSHALNRALSEAKGDLLAFTDDDVVVSRNWLGALTAALEDETWAGAAGRILPEKGFVPATWMDLTSRYGLAPLAIFDLGPAACELKEAPFGANMAFRKEMFSRHGNFRTDLGPQQGSEIRGEDTEFGARLLAAGERLRYEPSATVYHYIPACRTQRNYFQVWWFDKARGDVRELGIPEDTKWLISGVPLCLLRRIAFWSLRWLTTLGEPQRFSRKLKVWWLAGNIVEYHRQANRT